MNDELHRVVGIDLGTTYSAVAAYSVAAQTSEIIHTPIFGAPDGAATPSVVWWNPATQKVIVGEWAKRAIARHPENTVIEIKREMGETFTEELLDKFGARNVPGVGEVGKPVKVYFAGEWLLPQEISAFTLMHMKQIAEAELGVEIRDAVVTVPAYFKEHKRKATEEAALLAGLYPRQLIPEPTAAAYCYGLDRADEERHVYAVYDLGGGTFDVSVIVVEGEQIEVVATSGDPRLGGGDFDDAVTAWVLSELGIDPRANPNLARRIKARAERAKRALSYEATAPIPLPPLREGEAEPEPMEIDRTTFESKIEPILRKSINYLDDALNQAENEKGVRRADVDAILLIGGSTRIPLVTRMLLDHFGKGEEFIRNDANPDTVVARGAAIVAHRFPPSESFDPDARPDASLVNPEAAGLELPRFITEHTLGVGVQGNLVDALVRRNTNIPVSITKDDYTNPPNATNIRVPIYQGEGRYAYESELIGTIELGEIDPQPEGFHRFEVTFTLDMNGLLSVRVKHLNTSREYEANFEQNIRLGRDDFARSRKRLLGLYDESQLAMTSGSSAPADQGLPPPVTAADSQPAPPVELVEIVVEIPAEFRMLVRRVQRFLVQEPTETLSRAFNTFAQALNDGASADLEVLGDELADVFDDVRRH